MYKDQHTIESMGTARLVARNAYAYEDYLYSIFGRNFVLALPLEIKGPARLKARFASDKKASGEQHAPFIDLWIEFNPAMGLYTVRGEYWQDASDDEPLYKSSPRSGYDDDMLRDASRVFDWLDASVTMGEGVNLPAALESVAEAFDGAMSPAGSFVDLEVFQDPDGVLSLRLEPEMRMPKDYFVSGTHFPGMTGPDVYDYSFSKGEEEWFDSYVSPVQTMVQSTLDNLYGARSFKAEVDTEGYVYISPIQPIPPQNFGSYASDDVPTTSNLSAPMESKMSKTAWYADEIRRMAGVDGRERLSDRKLDEAWYDSGKVIDVSDKPKKKQSPAAKFPYHAKSKDDLAKFNVLVAKLKQQKKDGAPIKNPEALAQWIGLRSAGKKAHAESLVTTATIEQRMAALLKSK